MFSDRTGWSLAANRLAAALEARRRAGREILDLTVSNPTRAGIAYPAEEIAAAMAAGSAPHYDPDPRGLPAAREAIAASYAERGAAVDPERIVLTASTSEAYGWLFKLLCDPGDRVLAPRPSYPLFEYLARLESIEIAVPSWGQLVEHRSQVLLEVLSPAAASEFHLRIPLRPLLPDDEVLRRDRHR